MRALPAGFSGFEGCGHRTSNPSETMLILEKVVPFVVVVLIAGLILAQSLRGRANVRIPKITMPKRKRHLRAVNTKTMDRDLNELLKRK